MSLANESYVDMTLTDTELPVGAVSVSMNYRNTETVLIYTMK